MAFMDRVGREGAKRPKPKEDSKLAFFGRKRQGVDYAWRSFSCTEFAAALATLAGNGAAIMVGGAVGGSGAVISIYMEGDKHRTYLTDADALLDWCHDVLETFGSTSEDVYEVYGIKKRGG